MRVIGIGPGEPPPLEQDAELEAFMAERGWTYAADWTPPWEGDDEEPGHDGFWSRLIFKQVRAPEPDGVLVFQALYLGEQVASMTRTLWTRWVDLAEAALEDRCRENGVDYERSTA